MSLPSFKFYSSLAAPAGKSPRSLAGVSDSCLSLEKNLLVCPTVARGLNCVLPVSREHGRVNALRLSIRCFLSAIFFYSCDTYENIYFSELGARVTSL